MTTATLATGNRTMETAVRPRRSLEELVDWLMAALFSEQPQTEPATETLSVAKSVHEARRLRQAGDMDGALTVLPAWTRQRLSRIRLGGPTQSGRTW